MRYLLLSAAAIAIGASAALAQSTDRAADEREILEAEQRWQRAVSYDDAAEFDLLLAEDFLGVIADVDNPLTKTEWINLFRKPPSTDVAARLQPLKGSGGALSVSADVKIRLHGSVAVVTARNQGGNTPATWYTRVWIKGAEAWKVAVVQTTLQRPKVSGDLYKLEPTKR